MAKDIPVTDETAKQFQRSVELINGPAVAKILEEVGSCGWKDLLKKQNSFVGKVGGYSILGAETETLTVFHSTNYPVAQVTDKRCEKK